MPLKTAALEEPTINLTSMLDVVMLLIIFFMLATQFRENEKQVGIQLPTIAANSALSGDPDEIVVNIDDHGIITIKREVITVAEVELRMKQARENFPNQTVVIRGEGAGPYQYIMDIVGACRRSGIRNIKLAYKPQAEAKP